MVELNRVVGNILNVAKTKKKPAVDEKNDDSKSNDKKKRGRPKKNEKVDDEDYCE
uniref:Uncharacterized protein n=1 Tax=Panagrolaimus sp. ES5 TaxID=591445 RepID=A0AC34GIZ1_9BILA